MARTGLHMRRDARGQRQLAIRQKNTYAVLCGSWDKCEAIGRWPLQLWTMWVADMQQCCSVHTN
jgi:hypothetical protein